MKQIKVVIGIQARLKSKRLPEKCVKYLAGKTTIIDSLIDNCIFCANHINKKTGMYSVSLDTKVLVPESEKQFWNDFLRNKRVEVIEGDEDNVLSRYAKLSEFDYIVRLTADCPNVPPLVINKAVYTAIYHNLDYLANSWERYRTAMDGHDCEVMSNDCLQWLIANVHDKDDKEHVTLALRKKTPNSLRLGVLMGKEDLSHIKVCVDTADDF